MSLATGISGCWSAPQTRSTLLPVSHLSTTTRSPALIRTPVIRSSRQSTSLVPARWRTSAPACGAARTGLRWRTSPKTKLLYIPANENLCGAILGRPVTYTPGQPYSGVTSWLYLRKGADHIGELQAWDLDSKKKVWSHSYGMSENWGPLLATAGNVLFEGGTTTASSARSMPRTATFCPRSPCRPASMAYRCRLR